MLVHDSERRALSTARYFLPLIAVLMLTPWASSGLALILGILLGLVLGNPYLERTRAWTPKLLSYSVMGLGAAMDLTVVARVGLQGIGYTVAGISATLLMGTSLGRLFSTEKNTSLLITVGTAICGGSAIAAVAPTLRAKPAEISVALATVFLLNAFALVVFPVIGHHFALSENQFGLWAALAIHDTSSVVGATLAYGAHALEIGTTVKLARALWIVPVTLAIGWWRSRSPDTENGPARKAKRPWFILGFLGAAALVTWVPALQTAGHWVSEAAKHALVLTLFLIGTQMTRATLRNVGVKPLVQGVVLWALNASVTLGAVLAGWIH